MRRRRRDAGRDVCACLGVLTLCVLSLYVCARSLCVLSTERLEHTGLTPKTWLGAPADVMEQTLGFIAKRYGSVEAYLGSAGKL